MTPEKCGRVLFNGLGIRAVCHGHVPCPRHGDGWPFADRRMTEPVATARRVWCWLRGGHVDRRRPTDSGFTLCDRCGQVLL